MGLLNAAEAILLGFQHYLVMLGTTVLIPSTLVPQMGGGNVMLFVQLELKMLLNPVLCMFHCYSY